MKQIRWLLSGIVVGVAFTSAAAQTLEVQSVAGSGVHCDDAVCKQIVVRLQPNHSIAAINATFGTQTLRSIPSRRVFLLQLPPNANSQAFHGLLNSDTRVAWAELNYMVVAPNGGTQSFFLSASLGNYIHQPPIAIIGADEARRWASGGNQVVAVLDTGVDPDHPMIVGRLAPGGYNYVDDNEDFRDIGTGGTSALVGHGTMVSGLILRVAPRAQVLPMRVLNGDGVGSTFYIAQATYDAIDRGATVINASFGTIRPSQVVAGAMQAAYDSGIVVAAAAGNYDRSEPQSYPAGYEVVLGVGGTDWSDIKAPFSDYGSSVAISAPAVELASTFPGNAYAFASGNSMATALVSGSAALVRSQRPELAPQQVMHQLKIASDGIDWANPAHAGQLGSGRLNVLNAVALPTTSRGRR